MKRIRIGVLIAALLIPLLVGMLSAALSSKGMTTYGSMNKPPLSPPAFVFPVAWTILYLMMGLASYFIYVSDPSDPARRTALMIYAIQLAMNFCWSFVFFNWQMYLLAFIWLIVMWCIVIVCTYRFYAISHTAAYLMIPYILWLTFAAYLNIGTVIVQERI